MFTEPARAEPCVSGVGENPTSTRARLLIEIMSSAALRPVPPPGWADARLKPSMVIGTLAGGTPLIETSRAKPPELSMVMPGRNFMNSATLPSGTKPSSSVATTVLVLGAKRCSLIAMAAPSISLEVATTNLSSFTVVPLVSACAGRVETSARLKSCCVVCPATTTTGWVSATSPV